MNSRVKESRLLGTGSDFHFSAKRGGKELLTIFWEPTLLKGVVFAGQVLGQLWLLPGTPRTGGAELPRADRSRISGSVLLAPSAQRPLHRSRTSGLLVV